MIAEDAPIRAPGVGDNSRAAMLDIAREEQQSALDRFRQRRDDLIRSANAAVIRDRATAGSAGDVVKIAREVWELIDTDRKERTAPFREVQLELSGMVQDFWLDAVTAVQGLEQRVAIFMDADEERIRAQQAEQDAAMQRLRDEARASMQLPAAPPRAEETVEERPRGVAPPKRSKVRGDLGAVVSRGEKRVYRVDNARELPDWVLDSGPVRAAIDTVLRQSGKHMTSIAGVTIGAAADTQIR